MIACRQCRCRVVWKDVYCPSCGKRNPAAFVKFVWGLSIVLAGFLGWLWVS